MNEFEEYLSRVKRPDVRVDRFKNRLRRGLLDASSRPASGIPAYRAAFAGSAALCVVLAGLLVLFVAEPSYPRKLHDSLVGGGRFRKIEKGMVSAPLESGGKSPGGIPVRFRDPLAADRTYVQQWADQVLDARPVSIEPIDRRETFTISRFRLDGGKKYVQVYTLVPEETPIRRVSY